MSPSLLKSVAIGCSALGLSLMAHSALANLVANGGFSSFTGTLATGTQDLTTFANAGVANWTFSQGSGGNLEYLDNPGTEFTTGYLPVYGPATGPVTLGTDPDGGDFVQSDGNPNYGGTISQTINGLTSGDSYTLTFEQAAGQQVGFTGATTSQWKVSLGGSTQLSTIMNNPAGNGTTGGVVPWEQVSLTFVATSASEVLSFLAWGDGGSTVNLPPIAFLDGVDLEQTTGSGSPVPEPVSMSLMGVGLLGLGAVRWRRRAKLTAAD